MDRARSIPPSGGVMTFTGSLDFIDSQASLITIFGEDLPMISLTFQKKEQCATENTGYVFIRKWKSSVTFVVFILFAILSNLNMLTQMSMTRTNTCAYFSCTFETENGLFR